MLKHERKKFILNKLTRDQKVLIPELCVDLEVSDDTIRRDLKEMSEMGLLEKVHGGALPRSPIPFDYVQREDYEIAHKKNIANKARALIKPGQTILLDGGTTNLELVRALPRDLEITIFTNSFPLATEIMVHPTIEAYFLGGKINRKSRVSLGIEVIEALTYLRADLCMLGICSIDYDAGVTMRSKEECAVKRAFMQSAAQVIALSTTDKIGTAETYKLCDIDKIDCLITDDLLEESEKEKYRNKAITVL